MRARIERDVLRKALRTVAAVGKTNLPILSGVHIETIDGDGLRFTTSDLQLTITADVDASILAEGAVVAPARLLANYIDRCPDGAVSLEVKNDRLNVTSGDASLDLHLLVEADWPKVGPVEGEAVTLSAESVDLVRRILPLASIDDTRAVLCGVHFDGATAGVTDSWRMAIAHLEGDLPAVTIPMSALNAALKDATEVEVTFGETRATIAHDACTWTTVPIEGAYPDLGRLLRDSSPHSLTFDSAALSEALTRTGVLDDKGLMVKVQRDGDKANVWINNTDVGRADDIIGCDGDYDAPVGFNGAYLDSLLTAAQADRVTLELVDSLKPVIMRVPGLDLLCMPVRIG